MSSFAADVKYALRLWRKSPGFVAIAVGTLALGIGANSVIFSGVESFLLRPLPVPEPDRLVFMREIVRTSGAMYAVPLADFKDWRAGTPAFENIAGFRIDTFNLTGAGDAERVRGSRVTGDFFRVFGLPPAAGRSFHPDEDKPGAAPVVVLSDGFAKRRFAGAEAVGKTMTIDGEPHTVIGVMPQAMRFPGGFSDFWVPLGSSEDPNARGAHSLLVVGRLRGGVSLEDARRELDRVARNLEAAYPASNRGVAVYAVPLVEQLSNGPKRALMILWVAVAFVLLICCANLANLVLARSVYRSREFAVRQALGATRGQVLRQVLVESLLLSLAGGCGGLLIASWGLDALTSTSSPGLLPLGGLTLNLRVLAFTCALSIATGLVFGLLPAVRTLRADAADSLREGGRSVAGGRGRNRVSHVLVAAEVTLAVTLLAGAGLLVAALQRMQGTDMGFQPGQVLTAEIATKGRKYENPAARYLAVEDLLARLRSTPGITHAAAVNLIPMSNNTTRAYAIDARPALAGSRPPVADLRIATPEYANAMGIPTIAGRFLSPADGYNAEPVVVVNRRFADREWPGESAIGRTVALYQEPGKLGPPRKVVGVISDVRHSGPGMEPRPEIYLPFSQAPEPSMYLAIRTAGDPAAAVPALRSAVQAVDPDLPLSLVRPMETVMADGMAPARLTTMMLGILSAVALLLAAMGLYGVISYLVARRTYEFGVRIALGATRGNLLRLVMRNSLTLTSVGTALGLACAVAVSRLLGALIPGVQPEARVFLTVAAALAAIALAAAWFPLRRALAAGPLQALRSE